MAGRHGWSGRRFGRRTFLGAAGGTTAALLIGGGGGAFARSAGASASAQNGPFGALVPDPGGVLDLPPGFQYRIVSPEGGKLSNGATVPGDHDGMAAFAGPGGTTILIRNHEIRLTDRAATSPPSEPNPVPGKNPYKPNGTLVETGGTTAIVVGSDRREITDYVSSSGTRNNCAGGRTPWGTWLTCEEDRTQGHGYVFEVVPDDPEGELTRVPITGMGFFSHEATAIDPLTGIVYLTEDDFRGRIEDDPAKDTRSSFLYRYVPFDLTPRPGALQKGGLLQALKIDERPGQDADFIDPGNKFVCRWIDVDPAEPHDAALAAGCLRFNRLEGAHFAGGAFWFDDTAGGEKRLGQIYRYFPATNTLELFYEGTDSNLMESPDNITVTPWGDLWFAEDGDGFNRMMGITPSDEVYTFANNRVKVDTSGDFSELCGPCFSPDGQTFFCNIQTPGVTFVIWGPFPRPNAARVRQMAVAAPPAHLAPQFGGDLIEAAAKYGLSPLEAAAFVRHGVPLL